MTSPAPMPWIPENTFADRLIRLRRVMRWSAKEAALACRIPQQSWRNWEQAGARPRDYEEVCRRISERTGVSIEWLALGRRPETVEVRHIAPELYEGFDEAEGSGRLTTRGNRGRNPGDNPPHRRAA